MRISSLKPVRQLFSNGAAFNTQSHSSQKSQAISLSLSPSIMMALLTRCAWDISPGLNWNKRKNWCLQIKYSRFHSKENIQHKPMNILSWGLLPTSEYCINMMSSSSKYMLHGNIMLYDEVYSLIHSSGSIEISWKHPVSQALNLRYDCCIWLY